MDSDYNGGYAYSNGGSTTSSASSSLSSEDENTAKAKERDVLLWLITVAHGDSLRDDLKEPYYVDGQGNKQLKPDYVLGLTSAEYYASALGNIYRNPSYRNFTHAEVLHFLSKRGARPLVYLNGSPVTETDLGFNRPLRLRSHLILIDAIMLLAHKESLVPVPSSVLLDPSVRLFDRPAGKKTAFAPLPNTASWLNKTVPDESPLNMRGGDDLPENQFQPNHPQVTNIRLALEEKRRKKQGDLSKKGYDLIQQNARFGETAFIQSGTGSHRPPEDEHVYEEINENKGDESVINGLKDLRAGPRRAKWNEQFDHGASGDGPSPSSFPNSNPTNPYSTRQPPKPLPRRNVSLHDTSTSERKHPNGTSSSGLENGVYDMPDDSRVNSAGDGEDSALHQFLSSYETAKKPTVVRAKPKVIRNPTTSSPMNGSATFNAASFSGMTGNIGTRLRSPVVQREFTNSVDVLNPESLDRAGARENDVENGTTSFNLVDQNEDADMERKRQKLIQLQQKRRSEQEAARISKEQENSERADIARQRQDEANRKREEERIRRQLVFENYQRRKAEAKTAEDAPPPGHVTMRDNKPRRARPLSVHANSVVQPPTHHASFDAPMSNIMKKSPSQGDIMRVNQELSILSLHNPRLAAASARPGGNYTERRALSPPPRYRVGTADSTSDAGSSNSGQDVNIYNGPKLFKKPVTKSNRLIIHNAIRDCCLPGIVNEDLQKRALDTLAKSDGCHFFVLFRDANCQFRGVYAYDPDVNEAIKIYGTGPNRIDDSMTDKLYKYNSGMKKFTVITTTHHMSVQIDGITLQSGVWLGKKPVGHKAPLEIF